MPRNLLMMIAVAVLALFATAAFAQMVTGTITGTVKDNSGAFVPNARVTVTDTDENVVVRTLQTNGSGEYSAPLLPVGRYAVTAEAPKFKRSQQTNITLDVNANLTINFSLQVGSAQETVTVTQPPSEVDTETAQAQTVITSAQINELAVNTRNYEQLVTLMPGVSTGLASDQLYVGASNPVGTSNQINFSINGGRPTQNAWNIDGADNLDRGANLTLLAYPSLDSIQEFSVQRGQFGAEYGRGSSGQINVITKSGTNGFHGDLYEFFRNDDLDANNYLNNASLIGRPALRYNDFGGTIGGPIFKDKTFFFFSEEVRRVITYTTFQAVVPTAAERAGTFPVPVCLNASCTDTGTQVPTIDPAAQAYLTDIIDKIPLPSAGCTSSCFLTNVGRNIFNLHQEIVRIDQVFGSKFRLFGRFENDTIPTQEPGGLFVGDPLPGVSTTSTNSPSRIVMVHGVNTFSPTLLNDVGVNYSHGGITSNPTGLDTAANSPDVVNAVTLPYTETLGRVPDLAFINFSAINGFGPYRDYNDDYNAFDNLTKIIGRHALKFGATYHWYEKNENAANGNQGGFSFSSDLPATDPANTPAEYQEFASFLTGNTSVFSQTSKDFRAVIRQQQLELYAQDQFRVRPNLTLIYGLRYSLFRPMTDADGHLTNFDPALFSLANANQIDPCTGNLGIQTGTCASPVVSPPTGNPLNGIIIGGQNSPYGSAVTRQDNLDFAPRLGFAWDPYGQGKMSLRGGFGIYFDSPAVSRFESTVFDNPPFVTSTVIFNTVMDNPGSVVATAGNAPSPLVALGTNWKQPYTEEWSLDLQQEIFRGTFLDVGYYGNVGRHLTGIEDINQPQPGAYVTALAPYGVTPPITYGTTPQLNYIRPYPGYDAINSQITAFTSNYSGLQVSLKKQLGPDSFINVNYTWSHALTDADGDFATPQNTYDIPAEYGPAQFDRRNIFNANFVYNLPFYKTEPGLAGHVLGGWEFSGIITAYSGLPYSVYNYLYDPAGQGTIDGNSFASGRPDQIGNPNQASTASGPIHNFNQWFNPSAFTLSCTPGSCPAADVRPGNSGNGAVRGPGLQRWDLSLFKNTRINDRVTTQFRAEAFNVFNHTNPDGLYTAYGFGGFGAIAGVRDPRIMQLALKLYF
ncbi:MAG TPA: carboxypeptidase regulatory-like domain-containing protein [Terriglobales bacterium]|nr:carboxypeptidase regulatory-like domain-containing protein [Terriglobales bacterium]